GDRASQHSDYGTDRRRQDLCGLCLGPAGLPPRSTCHLSSDSAAVSGEAQPARTELLAEHAILGLEIVDYVELLLVDPAREASKGKVERIRGGGHELSVSE